MNPVATEKVMFNIIKKGLVGNPVSSGEISQQRRPTGDMYLSGLTKVNLASGHTILCYGCTGSVVGNILLPKK